MRNVFRFVFLKVFVVFVEVGWEILVDGVVVGV